MTKPPICLWCGRVVVLGHTDGTVKAVKGFADVGRQVEVRADLDYSQHGCDLLRKGMGVCQLPGSKTLQRGHLKLWKAGQEVYHNGCNCWEEIWVLHCDSVKSALVIEKCFNFKCNRGSHSEFYPLEIKVESIFHKEIAVHLISLPSL